MKTIKICLLIFVLFLTVVGCGDRDHIPPTVETFYPDPAIDGNVSPADIQANGIKVIFDEGMAEETIESTSFTVEEWIAGGTAVTGTVSYDESVRTASFLPDSALNSSWDYVVTVTTEVRDVGRNRLADDYVVTITVAAAAPPGSVP